VMSVFKIDFVQNYYESLKMLTCSQSSLMEVRMRISGMLKVITVTDDQKCALCPNELTGKAGLGCSCGSYPVELQCGHRFHVSCITHELISECPVCGWDFNEAWKRYNEKRHNEQK